MNKNIPLHQFIQDDATSIPFRIEKIDYKNSYNIEIPHRHNYYEIFLFEEGGGRHIIDFKEFELESKQLHFLVPGQVHLIDRVPKSKGYVIMFSRDFTHAGSEDKNLLFKLPFLHNFSNKPTITLTNKDFENIIRLFNDMAYEFEQENSFNEEIVQNYLNILLIKCKRLYQSNDEIKTEAQDLYQKFIHLLEKYYQEKHQVQEYADLLAISADRLNQITKEVGGMLASNMIHERILLEAKRLLIHTNYTSKEIAYALNFNDPAYFGRFFKSKTQLTPLQFKKEGKEKYHQRQ